MARIAAAGRDQRDARGSGDETADEGAYADGVASAGAYGSATAAAAGSADGNPEPNVADGHESDHDDDRDRGDDDGNDRDHDDADGNDRDQDHHHRPTRPDYARGSTLQRDRPAFPCAESRRAADQRAATDARRGAGTSRSAHRRSESKRGDFIESPRRRPDLDVNTSRDADDAGDAGWSRFHDSEQF